MKHLGDQGGRPPRDYSNDLDLKVIELALAFQVVNGMSERAAIDLALAWFQAERLPPSRQPRGARGKAGVLVGYRLPKRKSFHSRNFHIRQKFKTGRLRPDLGRVLALAQVLHSIR
jgi:hypothetical protein